MPKMKTHSGAKKRFSLTGTGKVKRKHAFKSHILTKKSTKAKRALTGTTIVDLTDLPRVKAMLTIGKQVYVISDKLLDTSMLFHS